MLNSNFRKFDTRLNCSLNFIDKNNVLQVRTLFNDSIEVIFFIKSESFDEK
jgi:hypothetical protein